MIDAEQRSKSKEGIIDSYEGYCLRAISDLLNIQVGQVGKIYLPLIGPLALSIQRGAKVPEVKDGSIVFPLDLKNQELAFSINDEDGTLGAHVKKYAWLPFVKTQLLGRLIATIREREVDAVRQTYKQNVLSGIRMSMHLLRDRGERWTATIDKTFELTAHRDSFPTDQYLPLSKYTFVSTLFENAFSPEFDTASLVNQGGPIVFIALPVKKNMPFPISSQDLFQ